MKTPTIIPSPSDDITLKGNKNLLPYKVTVEYSSSDSKVALTAALGECGRDP